MGKSNSELYAEQDGIKTYLGAGKGYHDGVVHYLIPCKSCGRVVDRLVYRRNVNYLCDYCKSTTQKLNKKKEKIANEKVLELSGIATPRQRQFDKAVDEIHRQNRGRFDKYETAIRKAETRCEDYGSIPEAMVAIELLRLGYKIIPQAKVGKMHVDFAIPDEKAIIEVDGSIYHSKEDNAYRDHAIKYHLGEEWEVLHIPAEQIRKQLSKMRKIMKMLQQQKK